MIVTINRFRTSAEEAERLDGSLRNRECLKAYFQSEDFKATKAASARQDATFSMYEVVAQ